MSDRTLFAVAGRPVLHSLSPVLFCSAYGRGGGASVYLRLSASTAAEALRLGGELDLAGMNITAPLKEAVFTGLGSVDDASAAIGAVNTIIRDGPAWRGFNTDPAGVAGALARSGIPASGRRCLVLGAGGAGRAAVFALRGLGAEVMLCSRADDKALAAARKLGVAAARWEDRSSALAGCDILVSCVPPASEAVRPDWLRPGLVVLEAAYPAPPLTRTARERGCVVIPGEDWLFGQALPAFRLLTGADPDEASMGAASRTQRPRLARGELDVALIGFMGSGKTTVGRLLASKLGLDFEDSDEWVEKRTGRTIPDIFHTEGEAFFRTEETLALRQILGERRGVVCACGGGSMESEANRSLVAAAGTVVVWLHAAAAVCRARIDAATRPLLGLRLKSDAAFDELFRARLSCYAKASDIAVGSEAGADTTARIIHEEIRRIVAA